MTKYHVSVAISIERVYEVEADSPEEARRKVTTERDRPEPFSEAENPLEVVDVSEVE